MEPSVILPELPTYLFAPTLPGLLSLILTVLLPLAAAVLMKQSWSALTKGFVLLALSGVKSYVEAWIAADAAGATFNHVTTLYALVINFGIAVAAYFGLLRGTALQRAAIGSGVTDKSGSGSTTGGYPTRH